MRLGLGRDKASALGRGDENSRNAISCASSTPKKSRPCGQMMCEIVWYKIRLVEDVA
jgi:hypothetical protein